MGLQYAKERTSKIRNDWQACYYSIDKRVTDFDEEENLFAQQFCPDRESRLNIDFNRILRDGEKNTEEKKYQLVYDENVIGKSPTNQNGIIDEIADIFERNGIDSTQSDESDIAFSKGLKKNNTNLRGNKNEDEDDLDFDEHHDPPE